MEGSNWNGELVGHERPAELAPWFGGGNLGRSERVIVVMIEGAIILVMVLMMGAVLNWGGSALAASNSWWWRSLGWFVSIVYAVGYSGMFSFIAWPVLGRGALALASPWHDRRLAIAWSAVIIASCAALLGLAVVTYESTTGRAWYGVASAQGFWDGFSYVFLLAVLVLLVSILATQARHLVRLLRRPGASIESETASALPALTPKNPPSLIHWSDLHIGTTSTTRLFGHKVPVGNAVLRRLIQKHRPILESAEALLITGDVTDRGGPEEWKNAFEIFGEFRTKIVLVPGNHDLNLSGLPYPKAIDHAIAELRCLLAMGRLQGDRARIWHDSRVCTLTEFLKEVPPLPVPGKSHFRRPRVEREWARSVESLWERAFPMAVSVGSDLSVIVLNSNSRNVGLLDNALGKISTKQIERAAWIYRELSSQGRVVFACHHHLEHVAGALGTFLAIVNAHEAHDILPEDANVFHGHRHFEYHHVTKAKRIVLNSAPSTTLGHEGKAGDELNAKGPGFYAYTLVRDGSCTRLSARSWFGLGGAAHKDADCSDGAVDDEMMRVAALDER